MGLAPCSNAEFRSCRPESLLYHLLGFASLTALVKATGAQLSPSAAVHTTKMIFRALLGVEMYCAFMGWQITRYLQVRTHLCVWGPGLLSRTCGFFQVWCAFGVHLFVTISGRSWTHLFCCCGLSCPAGPDSPLQQ